MAQLVFIAAIEHAAAISIHHDRCEPGCEPAGVPGAADGVMHLVCAVDVMGAIMMPIARGLGGCAQEARQGEGNAYADQTRAPFSPANA
jgi:hypothetical protein